MWSALCSVFLTTGLDRKQVQLSHPLFHKLNSYASENDMIAPKLSLYWSAPYPQKCQLQFPLITLNQFSLSSHSQGHVIMNFMNVLYLKKYIYFVIFFTHGLINK